MPGVLGGVFGALAASLVADEIYGENKSVIFAAMADGRTPLEQAGF